MAVRSSQRASQGKRSGYVSEESTMDESSSSCEKTSNRNRRKNKVRSVKSIRSLYIDGCSYEKSEEHAYTSCVRRVRRPTESSEDTVSKSKRQCYNKNAVNAKLNREKKKAYLASVEEELRQLKEVNVQNQGKLKEQDLTIEKMKQEMMHMKSLLANNKYLNNLVSKLSQVTGLPVTSSFISKMHEEDGEIAARTRSVPRGVNHPVCNNDVSLGGRDREVHFPQLPQSQSCLNSEQPELSYLEDNYFVDYEMKELFPFDFVDYENERNSGICVHINQSRLSVEFCTVCNTRANAI